MSAETFTTAIFLITAVIATGVLINAVFPVVYNMAGTFSSSSHQADERLRTDFKIVTYYSTTGATPTVNIWMKNVGSAKIPVADIERSDIFCGEETQFTRLNYNTGWTTEFVTDSSTREYDLNGNGYWDPGETLHITAYPTMSISSGENVYFQFILPGGTWRSQTFTAS